MKFICLLQFRLCYGSNRFPKIKLYTKQIYSLLISLFIYNFVFHLPFCIKLLKITVFCLIGQVCELDELEYIPTNNLVSKTFVNCNLPKP